jgi:chorismate dehydratase
MIYRLALVNYLNTLPFSEGLKLNHFDTPFEIFPVTPSQCATMYEEGKVDISLCPIGALNELPPYKLWGNYCIGADGEVSTVVLLSKVPLEQITSVRFDDHSRTSNMLLQILAKRYWKKDWDYYFSNDDTLADSCLMIGDKVFKNKVDYSFHYDLASAWKMLTGLPMVFAVWIARPDVPEEVLHQLDVTFQAGMEIIVSGNNELKDWQRDYLVHNISYPFDKAKQEAMQLFFQWAASVEAVPAIR